MSIAKTSTTSVSSSPLPYLPLEVKGHILRFCDPPTLFSTSLVSLAFLELSCPILYEDVVVRGVKQLADLLCVEIEHPQPQLERHLSLSFIRNLTYYHPKVGTPSGDTARENLPRLRKPYRLQRQGPLPLHLNRLHLLVDELSRWHSGGVEPRERVEALFSYLSPRSFVFEGVLPDVADEEDRDVVLPLVSLTAVGHWTRLEVLAFINGFTLAPLARSSFFSHDTTPSLKVGYDLSGLKSGGAYEGWFRCLSEDLRGEGEIELDRLQPEEAETRLAKIEKVEVVVGTEQRRMRVWEGLQGASTLARTTVVVRPAA